MLGGRRSAEGGSDAAEVAELSKKNNTKKKVLKVQTMLLDVV